MKVTLCVLEGVIRGASYETYQCPTCHACGKAVCEMVQAMTLDQARGVDRSAVANRVGPVPRAKAICYGLAALALFDALKQLEKE